MTFKITAILIMVGIAVFLVSLYFRQATNNKNWSDDAKILQDIVVNKESFIVQNLRNWKYNNLSIAQQDYADVSFKFSDLESIYYMSSPLDITGLTAHTYLNFEFKDNKSIGLSIEARKSENQQYSSLKGLMRSFEVIYVWANSSDHDSRRTELYGSILNKYELELSPAQKIAVLRLLLTETQDVNSNPRFYNTFFGNCTNLLAQAINTVIPDSIPWHYSFILTGRSDEYLRKLGYVK